MLLSVGASSSAYRRHMESGCAECQSKVKAPGLRFQPGGGMSRGRPWHSDTCGVAGACLGPMPGQGLWGTDLVSHLSWPRIPLGSVSSAAARPLLPVLLLPSILQAVFHQDKPQASHSEMPQGGFSTPLPEPSALPLPAHVITPSRLYLPSIISP